MRHAAAALLLAACIPGCAAAGCESGATCPANNNCPCGGISSGGKFCCGCCDSNRPCWPNPVYKDWCDAPAPPPTNIPTKFPTASPTTAAPTTTAPTTAAPSTWAVGGDPFTTDARGNKVQFFIPLRKQAHLLTCGDLQLNGRAMSSGIAGDHQQWFDAFTVLRAGRELLKVEAAPAGSNITAQPESKHRSLTTVRVTVDGAEVTETAEGAVSVEAGAAHVAVTQDKEKRIGQGFSETVQLSVGSTVLQFQSATASKFSSETLQALHAHLDLRFAALNAKECSAGVLAEIWGNAPMSKETAAMLQPPAHQ